MPMMPNVYDAYVAYDHVYDVYGAYDHDNCDNDHISSQLEQHIKIMMILMPMIIIIMMIIMIIIINK